MKNTAKRPIEITERKKYCIITIYALLIMLSSLIFNSPYEIILGLKRIIVSPSLLLTDYMIVGNIGASLINSGLLMLMALFVAKKYDTLFNGPLIAAVFTIGGFAFFGKNIFNVVSIVFGVYLFCFLKKEHFTKYIMIAYFGTALSPLISIISFDLGLNLIWGMFVGNVSGILVGLILPPLASSVVRFHQGFCLYNVGFTSGLIGMLIMSIFRHFGIKNESGSIIYEGSNLPLGIYFGCLFVSMILVKFIFSTNNLSRYKKLLRHPGRLVTDFVILDGFDMTLFNMGIMGLIGLIYVLLVGGQLNGPVIGGVFTLVGFGAFGKHPKNAVPIMVGVFIAAMLTDYGVSSTSAILAALFGTALAPVAGHYGWKFGILAGFLHMTVVTNVGYLHGGLNLYNNGFASGFVAAILVPIIEAFKEEDYYG